MVLRTDVFIGREQSMKLVKSGQLSGKMHTISRRLGVDLDEVRANASSRKPAIMPSISKEKER
jgi:hypothetical protein